MLRHAARRVVGVVVAVGVDDQRAARPASSARPRPSASSSSPGSMTAAMLSLAWYRQSARCNRSRIFCDTGTPRSVDAAAPGGGNTEAVVGPSRLTPRRCAARARAPGRRSLARLASSYRRCFGLAPTARHDLQGLPPSAWRLPPRRPARLQAAGSDAPARPRPAAAQWVKTPARRRRARGSDGMPLDESASMRRSSSPWTSSRRPSARPATAAPTWSPPRDHTSAEGMVYVAVDGWVEWRLGPMYVQERPFPKGVPAVLAYSDRGLSSQLLCPRARYRG